MVIRLQKIFVSFVLLLLVGGCKNPFSTRGSEPPTGQPGTWTLPSYPEDLLENLANAYRQENVANLVRCLSDDFRFAAPENSVENPPLFQNWDREVERSVTREIFSLVSPESLSIFLELDSSSVVDELFEDSSTIYREYELVVEGSATAPLANPAKGLATFSLRKEEDGLWYPCFWLDEPLPPGESNTWADLKVERWRP